MPSTGLARKVLAALKKLHPDAACSLHYKTPLELLVATILSAQCTDERVNKVTPALFRKYRTAEDYAKANLSVLQREIRSTGFYRQKAKTIQGIGKILRDRFGGEVPRTMEELITLPGVWRKTANVILGNVYDVPGIVVDTHVRRLANRIGLSKESDPDKIEIDLMKQVPKRAWTLFSHLLIFHGRRICKAIKPACGECPLGSLCPRIGVRN
ncbi:MAG: endonuclease III [Candidatus Omnitrophica bacterium]|nr:endonuclease III [Candidatus Omnitrophota bacterium]